ncbi:MFS transporter [Ideonella sp. YS5]|uniref:MFS transporter n=1 Tax=Ideonella sp. YS5 TaxID=3453714 RepID=UPI003EEC9661
MSLDATAPLTRRHIAAALAIGTLAVLMIGLQPILLGELVERQVVSLEGVGLVAMGEIVGLGLGILLGDALLPWSHLRRIALASALLSVALDVATLWARGDGQMLAVRAAAGLAEGVLVWGATGVIVRTGDPARLGGVFFVTQTLAQALVGAALANAVLPHGGWRAGFAALAVLTLLTLPLAFIQPARLQALAAPAASGFRWSAVTVLPLAMVFLQLAAIGAFWAYLEPLGKAAGLDARAAQTLISGVLVMQVLGGLASTAAVRRLPVLPVLAVGSVLLAVFALGSQAGGELAFGLACAAFGFAWLFLFPFQIAVAFRVDPSGRLAMLVPAAQLLGSAFGPLIASLLVSGEDASPVPMLAAAFAVAGAMMVMGARRRSAMAAA